MVVAISLGAVHTHTHTHTGSWLNNHILSCSKVNRKELIGM